MRVLKFLKIFSKKCLTKTYKPAIMDTVPQSNTTETENKKYSQPKEKEGVSNKVGCVMYLDNLIDR